MPGRDRVQAQALIAWRAADELEVPEVQRYAIYAAFGPRGDAQATARRTLLSLLAARRVAPIYAEAVRVVDPPEKLDTPYRLFMERLNAITTAALRGSRDNEAAFAEAFEAAGDRVYELADIADEKNLGDAAWVLAQRAGYAYAAALAAVTTASLGYRVEGYRPVKGLIGRAVFRGEALDAAALAALAEAWMGDALPPDAARLRAYWRWWLEEAVPRAMEWDPPSGKS